MGRGSTASEAVPVVIVQMQGSPGQVYEHIEDALAEARSLIETMQGEQCRPVPIQIRTGTMGRAALDSLREFPGY